jgi:hypothetical protein
VRFNVDEDADMTEFALSHGVPTRRCYRSLAASVYDDIDASKQPVTNVYSTVQRVAQALRKRRDEDGVQPEVWFLAGGLGLRYLALQLHALGITCEARLSTYTTWSLLKFPALKLSIRSCSSDAMGGLHPDEHSEDDVHTIARVFDEELETLKRQTLSFRVVSQYSLSLQQLLDRF